MIIISVLLIIILSLLLRYTLKKFKKRASRRSEGEGVSRMSSPHISHTHLDQDMPYALLPTIAPPSYQDTLLADQVVQTLNTESAEGEGRTPQEEEEEETNSSSSTHVLLVTDDSEQPPQYTEAIA